MSLEVSEAQFWAWKAQNVFHNPAQWGLQKRGEGVGSKICR